MSIEIEKGFIGMIALIFGYWIGQVLAPFLIVGLILWFFYELIFNFWATIDVVCSVIAWAVGIVWDIASGIFMYVWDITLVGPILAVGGTCLLLRYFFAPVLTVLFWICAVPVIVLVELFKKLPKAGMNEPEAADSDTASSQPQDSAEGPSTNHT